MAGAPGAVADLAAAAGTPPAAGHSARDTPAGAFAPAACMPRCRP
ncbi:Hypothetical protein I596_648 [Dokdonella koreensis DS-123]|uniref:Uncharacterized protein n=1 Tax=Dokdonella koreensis DS-123 TaxID=1300342 RepID=A0A167GL77_9GAMM|nr:Hypothetical protein I596_648 [Dokdonella koreensis DS-123]